MWRDIEIRDNTVRSDHETAPPTERLRKKIEEEKKRRKRKESKKTIQNP